MGGPRSARVRAVLVLTALFALQPRRADAADTVTDGGWSYFGDPRAIYADGRTFVGWTTSSGQVQVGSFRKGEQPGRVDHGPGLPHGSHRRRAAGRDRHRRPVRGRRPQQPEPDHDARRAHRRGLRRPRQRPAPLWTALLPHLRSALRRRQPQAGAVRSRGREGPGRPGRRLPQSGDDEVGPRRSSSGGATTVAQRVDHQ